MINDKATLPDFAGTSNDFFNFFRPAAALFYTGNPVLRGFCSAPILLPLEHEAAQEGIEAAEQKANLCVES